MEEKYFEAKYPQTARFSEMQQLITHIKTGNSPQIISIPGAGRSTMLGLLAFNPAVRKLHLGQNHEQFHFVMVHFLDLQRKPVDDAIKFIFLQIVNSLEDRPLNNAYEKAKKIFDESIVYNDPLLIFEGLKKVIDLLALQNRLTIVLLFEQFEMYIPNLTPTFFTYLRSLRNQAKYAFSVVFSLHKPIEYVLEPTLFADFEEFIEDHGIYLPLFDKPSLEFRIHYIENAMQKSLPDPLQKDIVSLTAGHARLTRLAVEKTLELEKTPDDLLSFLLSQKVIENALNSIWQSLNPAEQTHFLKNLYPQVLDDEHSRYLEKAGLMTKTGTALPLFAAFAKSRQKPPQEHKLSYNSETKTIVLGDTDISEKFTATEFRLLRFFLENREKVVDRDEIIATVWNDNKSFAGVTDQALDQLIFRLRRKIEDDPNNPTHIVTVKGRGFRFVP